MNADLLRACLVGPDTSRALLAAWGVVGTTRGHENLAALAGHLGVEGLGTLAGPLGRLLPRCADPDMALNNLERLLATPAGRALVPQLVEGRARALEVVLGLLSSSQMFSDMLAQNPDWFAIARAPRCGADELRDGLRAEVEAAHDDAAVLRAFRRFRHRQLLRIGTNDIVRGRPLDEITGDISLVANVAIGVALETAERTVSRRLGRPHAPDGAPVSCCVLAFGKLGGEELNYSSDIDLMFVYSEEGETRGERGQGVPAEEFYFRVVGEVVRLLGANTGQGQAYRIDLRLRPEGQRGPLARSLESTLSYYDTLGRTWERQALIKARPVAGDLDLGARFLRAIEPFVYRKYLTFTEINEIKALKRQIEQKARQAGVDGREVKTGHGGIRDIEFTIQFLQLLNGGDLPAVRRRNTLAALSALEQAGCLIDPEYRVLEDAYRFLRKTEHRLQLMFDLQTHRLPEGDDELARLARRMGYAPPHAPAPPRAGGRRRGRPQPARPDDLPAAPESPAPLLDPREAFLRDYRDKTGPTRKILEHLLHQTFAGSPDTAEPEVDLLLDPSPSAETVRAVLGRYPFRDIEAAYADLVRLGQEVPFLSPRRCRHFLASIAPSLLRAVAETPDPDLALRNLEKVTASLGAKTVLWELFSFNPPSLKLYVDLCANSQLLSEILINNPGMIDELLDSLVLNQPRRLDELQDELADLVRGAADPEPMLHSFQDKELLRLGVRDILGKQTVRETAAGLSDLAEAILVQVARTVYLPVEVRHGAPLLAHGPRWGQPCRVAIFALGKLGSREMNYHSDLDLLVMYEGEGRSYPPEGSRAEPCEAGTFYTEFAQRLIRMLGQAGPLGRLYQVDMRLRPAGRSGPLVLPLAELQAHYAPGGPALLWERQALTRARLVHAEGDFGRYARQALADAAYGNPWRPEMAAEVAAMREKVAAGRPPRDLKRGPGGLADIEFLVQRYLLEHGGAHPALRTPNIGDALDALHAAGILDEADHRVLTDGYAFLVRVQNRLRIAHNRTIDVVSEEPDEVDKLARRLGLASGRALLETLEAHRRAVREVYRRRMG